MILIKIRAMMRTDSRRVVDDNDDLGDDIHGTAHSLILTMF